MEHYFNHVVARRWLAAATALAATSLSAVPAQATPGSGFVGTQVARGLYGEMDVKGEKSNGWDIKLTTKADSDLHVTRNAIAIGGHSGWHTHPGPSLITVTVGEITAYDSDDPLCSPRVYRAGQGFIDSGHHAHILRNESGAVAETVAVQFLESGASRRIDAPAPNNCNF